MVGIGVGTRDSVAEHIVVRRQTTRTEAPSWGSMAPSELCGATMLERGSLPVADLASLAVREGQRPRPVYGAHKWFARRLGSAFRSLLVASCLPTDGDFWRAYEDGVDLSGKTILDPFVGGGTSVVEGQRMGARCLGTDVDPVAVSVSRFQSRMHGLSDLKPTLARLAEEVGTKVGHFHTRPDGRTVLHHFWVQVVECRSCALAYDAHPHFVLAAEVDKPEKHVVCRHCGAVQSISRDEEAFRCGSCGGTTEAAQGNVVFGSAVCPHCGESERLIDHSARMGRPPRFRIFATESLPAVRGGRPVPMRDRLLAKADEHDVALFNLAEGELRSLLADSAVLLPERRIPARDRSDDRLCRYGYEKYVDLFNARQQLHLALLGAAINGLDEGLEREALAIAFSDHLKSCNQMAGYAVGYRRLSPLFALRAFRHIPRPVELNPWVAATGRGGFPNAVRQIERAAEWSRKPREYRLCGGFAPPRTEAKGPADVRRCSASSLTHIPDGSVDMVLTDPPYFDNIAYSELADFFLPWQRMLGLVDAPDLPGLPPEQLAAPGRSRENGDVFRDRLAACFIEISRKLKSGGLAVFTYQHRTGLGWEMLADALARSPLRVVNLFPMPGDVGTSLHRHEESISWDAVLVARKIDQLQTRPGPALADTTWAAHLVNRWERNLAGVKAAPFRAADRDNLWRAALVASSLKHAEGESGQTDLAQALGLPWSPQCEASSTVRVIPHNALALWEDGMGPLGESGSQDDPVDTPAHMRPQKIKSDVDAS